MTWSPLKGPHLLIPSHWDLGFQHMNLQGHKHLVHNRGYEWGAVRHQWAELRSSFQEFLGVLAQQSGTHHPWREPSSTRLHWECGSSLWIELSKAWPLANRKKTGGRNIPAARPDGQWAWQMSNHQLIREQSGWWAANPVIRHWHNPSLTSCPGQPALEASEPIEGTLIPPFKREVLGSFPILQAPLSLCLSVPLLLLSTISVL